MFGALYAPEGTPTAALITVARDFSPRLRTFGTAPEVVIDLTGLTRLFGSTREIAEHVRRSAADRGLRVRVSIAGTQTAARLLVRHRAGITVIEPGEEAGALAPLPVAMLAGLHSPASAVSHGSDGPANRLRQGFGGQEAGPHVRVHGADDANVCATLARWGVRTLGALAALPADELAARLGQCGVQWQRAARGEDAQPLVPSVPEERFEQALELEWPIDGLEPLSFVLGRLLEPLSAHLERRDRGAAVLHVRLHLITREVHTRSLQLPIPMRDARTLRTLILLDLESHPPPAAIDQVVIAVDPTPGRIVQFSLLARPLPTVERISTLMARLQALMGETRCGSPAVVDSWEPGAFAMKPFMPVEMSAQRETSAQRKPRDEPQRPRDTESNRKNLSVSASLPAAPEPHSGDDGPAAPEPHSGEGGWFVSALRRFRHPIIARVRLEERRPVRVHTDRRELPGGRVETCAGPWRTSGAWWCEPAAPKPRSGEGGAWDREEWDVTLADGGTYRIFRDRRDDKWFVEGQVD